MMIGITRTPIHQLPPKRNACDDCGSRFLDRECIEVRGANAVLYLHQRCAESLAADFEREVQNAK